MLSSDLAQTAQQPAALVAPRHVTLTPSRFSAVVLHLVKRELDSTHRMTVLGWAWPVLRQLAQLAILTFIFGSVIDLHIKHFPVYVFSGLLSWTWFASGVGAATTSLLDQRHLLFQPRFPAAVIPIVAMTVPLVDLVIALPLLLTMGAFEEGLRWTAFLLPALVALQFTLMMGLAWIFAIATVFFRDVPNVVAVGLQAIFYMTPVFYKIHAVPHRYGAVLDANPLSAIVDGYRAVLLGLPSPSPARYLTVGLVAVLGIAAGSALFRRNASRLVDSL
jgi:lipopolysaccharide transport system permease protein